LAKVKFFEATAFAKDSSLEAEIHSYERKDLPQDKI